MAIATHTPPSRRIGRDSRAATAPAMSAPIGAATSTDMSYRDAIWNTVNAPIAANAPWQSEI